MAANYAEAVSMLKKRFGNKQQIISKHMENLLGIDGSIKVLGFKFDSLLTWELIY